MARTVENLDQGKDTPRQQAFLAYQPAQQPAAPATTQPASEARDSEVLNDKAVKEKEVGTPPVEHASEQEKELEASGGDATGHIQIEASDRDAIQLGTAPATRPTKSAVQTAQAITQTVLATAGNAGEVLRLNTHGQPDAQITKTSAGIQKPR